MYVIHNIHVCMSQVLICGMYVTSLVPRPFERPGNEASMSHARFTHTVFKINVYKACMTTHSVSFPHALFIYSLVPRLSLLLHNKYMYNL